MRSIIAIAALFSVSAWACPDLAGTYTCKSAEGQEAGVVTVSQESKDGVTYYDYNGSVIPADNVAHQLPDEDFLREATMRAWCGQTTMNAEMLGDYYMHDSYFGKLNVNIEIFKDGANLKQVTKGSVVSEANDVYPIESEFVCTPN